MDAKNYVEKRVNKLLLTIPFGHGFDDVRRVNEHGISYSAIAFVKFLMEKEVNRFTVKGIYFKFLQWLKETERWLVCPEEYIPHPTGLNHDANELWVIGILERSPIKDKSNQFRYKISKIVRDFGFNYFLESKSLYLKNYKNGFELC